MEQSDWVKKFLKQTSKNRKKLKLKESTKIRKRICTKKNLKWTKKDILDVLMKNNINTLKELELYNRYNSERISIKTVKELFGSWGNCKKQIDPDYIGILKFNEEDVIRLLASFKVLTVKDFQTIHEKEPMLIPSFKYVINHFGTWSNLKRVIQSQIKEDILKRYMDLKFELKRYPTRKECKEKNIEIDVLEEIMTMEEIKDFISQLEKYYVKSTKSKNK